jgi:type IV secretory pathway TraG/TraD family ATPase VirD4
VDRKGGHRLVLEDDVISVPTSTGEPSYALTQEAVANGAVRLEWQRGKYNCQGLHRMIGHWIFHDQPLTEQLKTAGWGGLAAFVAGIILAIPSERKRMRIWKHGRRLKGPELVTSDEFNQRYRSDGIGFVTNGQSWLQRWRGKNPVLRLPHATEASHFLIVGDTGSGKSSLIRQMLEQIEERGESAIVYDPAREYTPQFYRPERGDVILNPLDQRMPYWSPGEEVRHEAEALTLAASLFPDRPNDNRFFTRGPREVFAHLLTFNPTPAELAWWMSHDEEIDRRVQGTDVASTISQSAPAQREGVLAELKMVANVFKLLPSEKETKQRWNTLEWSKERRGWLFLPSTPESRERLAPLMSLWLDTLVLRLMNQGQVSSRRTWFVLDELASLQKLPQLHTAVTENRKSGNPVVLGFQGRSQLETRYGHEAEAMLSQPATKIFLKTSEARAAEWISKMIGEVEIERLRETRSDRYRGAGESKSYSLDRRVEPLVMASEITGLRELHGYLKCGNLVVPMGFPFVPPEQRQPGILERPLQMRRSVAPATASAAATNGGNEYKIEPAEQSSQKKGIGQEQRRLFR